MVCLPKASTFYIDLPTKFEISITVCSFVRSLRAGSSLLWTTALRPYSGPVRLPRERKGIGRCVRCVLATCRVKEGLSKSEQLVRYIYSAPLLDYQLQHELSTNSALWCTSRALETPRHTLLICCSQCPT